MAAPKRNRSQRSDPAFEKTRKKIKITQLVNRLTKHALGENDTKGKKIDLSATQVRAIEILLKKAIPDLQAISLTGADGKGPVEIDGKLKIVFVDAETKD